MVTVINNAKYQAILVTAHHDPQLLAPMNLSSLNANWQIVQPREKYSFGIVKEDSIYIKVLTLDGREAKFDKYSFGSAVPVDDKDIERSSVMHTRQPANNLA
eukprot:3883710-Rhodomonas_salina.1